MAVFEQAVVEIAARVEPAYRQADSWLEQVRAGLVELLRFCDEQPDMARELVVESIAWGPEVLERRGQLLDALAGALERGRMETDSPALVPLAVELSAVSPASAGPTGGGETPLSARSPEVAENLVGACVSLVHTRLLQEERGPFVELAPALMCMIAHPYLGPGAARLELERSLTSVGTGPASRGSEGGCREGSREKLLTSA